MITKLLLTVGLSALVSTGIYHVGEPCMPKEEIQMLESSAKHNETIKAIHYEGQVIPLIDLPIVEIRGTINRDNFVKGMLVDGVVYPSIQLDEVTITPDA